MLEDGGEKVKDEQDLTKPDSTIRRAASMRDVLDRAILTRKAEERRKRQLVTTFDVDGPCTVAIPFNYDWEWFPHLFLRTTSVYWVVESIEQVTLHEDTLPATNDQDISDGPQGTTGYYASDQGGGTSKKLSGNILGLGGEVRDGYKRERQG